LINQDGSESPKVVSSQPISTPTNEKAIRPSSKRYSTNNEISGLLNSPSSSSIHSDGQGRHRSRSLEGSFKYNSISASLLTGSNPNLNVAFVFFEIFFETQFFLKK